LFNDFTDFSGVVVGAAGSVLDRRFIHKPICQPNEKITNDLVESKLRKKSEEIIQTAKAPAKKLEETDIVAKVEKNFEKFSKSSLINKLPNPDDSIENLKKNSEENKDSKDKEGFGNLKTQMKNPTMKVNQPVGFLACLEDQVLVSQKLKAPRPLRNQAKLLRNH